MFLNGNGYIIKIFKKKIFCNIIYKYQIYIRNHTINDTTNIYFSDLIFWFLGFKV